MSASKIVTYQQKDTQGSNSNIQGNEQGKANILCILSTCGINMFQW